MSRSSNMESSPRSHLVGSERDKVRRELRAKYNAGATVRQLAAETGYSYGRVHKLLTETGHLRSRRGVDPKATTAKGSTTKTAAAARTSKMAKAVTNVTTKLGVGRKRVGRGKGTSL